MIKYNLTCECNYTFDSWFASSKEFERLIKKKVITCIECSSTNIKKSLMSPNLSNAKKNEIENSKYQKKIKKKIHEYQKFIKENCRYVGNRFAQEARSIHYNDNKDQEKGIYGKITKKEIEELNEEGIETTTIPWFDKTEN